MSVSVLAALVFGLGPALRCARMDVSEKLKSHGGNLAARRDRLVVLSEAARATLLLLASGVALKRALRLIQ